MHKDATGQACKTAKQTGAHVPQRAWIGPGKYGLREQVPALAACRDGPKPFNLPAVQPKRRRAAAVHVIHDVIPRATRSTRQEYLIVFPKRLHTLEQSKLLRLAEARSGARVCDPQRAETFGDLKLLLGEH
jgi:hypothetical protein